MTDREVIQMALDALDSDSPDIQLRAATTLRARLAQREEKPEPVAWMCLDDPERETAFTWKNGHCKNCGKNRIPLYTAPPQREWQGLTVQESGAIMEELDAYGTRLYEFARAIEAKLKEKNT